MKIIIAVDSFKDCLTSVEAAHSIRLGIYDVLPNADVHMFPLADGGEGTVEALVSYGLGTLHKAMVQGPMGEKIEAEYGILEDQTAVIEIAAACGLPLVPAHKRNPLVTTSYGVGQLIKHAIGQGCRKFIIGLGGSATNDGGIGMLSALGWRFLDIRGQEAGINGASLEKLASIDTRDVLPELQDCQFQIACDVDNPLFGLEGAAYVYAPQKGADQAVVEQLDIGLRHYAEIILQHTGEAVAAVPGAGAAGGLGAAFISFLHAQVRPGIELVLEHLSLEEEMEDTQLVITGEGRLDNQTARGKAPLGVARLAAQRAIPVIALAGSVKDDNDALYHAGITSSFSIVRGPMRLEEAMEPEQARRGLRQTTKQIIQLVTSF